MSGTADISWFQAFDMKTLVLVFLMVLYISAYVMGVTLALFREGLPDSVSVVGANALMVAGNMDLHRYY